MVQETQRNGATTNNTLHYSFTLLKRWLQRWGHQFPNGTPLTYRQLLLPLNRDANHWACIAIDIPNTTITYLDSHIPEDFPGQYGLEYADQALRFIHDEHQRAFHTPDDREWTLLGSTPETVPQQTNGYDCGVYACLFMDYILQGLPLSVTPDQAQGAQPHMALAIIQGRALQWYGRPPPYCPIDHQTQQRQHRIHTHIA